MELKIGDYVTIHRQESWSLKLNGLVGKVLIFPDPIVGPCRRVLVEIGDGNYMLNEYYLSIATDVEILAYKLRG